MSSIDPIAPVLAYLGPGGALSAVGSFVALLGAVVLAIIGFLWLPLKRLVRGRRERRNGILATPPQVGTGDARG